MPDGKPTYEEYMQSEAQKQFEDWLKKTYSSGQINAIKAGNIQEGQSEELAGYFEKYVYKEPTRWPYTPTISSITQEEWQTLAGSPQYSLNQWIQSGKINPLQAQEIANELTKRKERERAEFLGAIGQAEIDRIAKEGQPREGEMSQEEATAMRRAGISPITGEFYARSMPARRETVDYAPEWEKVRQEFAGEVPQTEKWMEWFGSRYSSIVQQFKAQYPVGGEKIEGEPTWADFLRARKPEIKEQWYKMTPYQRGEYPSRYAPRIQSVRF